MVEAKASRAPRDAGSDRERVTLYITYTFVLLVVADSLTKWLLPTKNLHPGLVDPRTFFYVGLLVLLAWQYTRLPATVTLAGVVGNAIWTAHPGGVPNVFGGQDFYYNLADVMIVAGGWATVLMVFVGGADLLRRKLARSRG